MAPLRLATNPTLTARRPKAIAIPKISIDFDWRFIYHAFMDTATIKKYSTVNELAEMCGVTCNAVYAWVASNSVKAVRLEPVNRTPTARPCNRIRFTRTEVRRVLRRLEQGLPVG